MRKSVFIGGAYGLFSLVAGTLGAAPTWSETSDGKYEVVVPAGESYTLTAADVAAIGERDLVKNGEGTLVAGAEMAAFAHDIYITNGIYSLAKQGGLGSVATVTHTYVRGAGTLENKVGSSGGNWNCVPSLGTNEHVHVEGRGFEGQGAIVSRVGSNCLAHQLSFTDDTLIVVTGETHLRQYPVDMGGHRIAVKGLGKDASFRFVSLSASNPGDLDLENCQLGFNDGSCDRNGHTVTIGGGGGLILWNSSNRFNDHIVMANNTRLTTDNGTINLGKVTNPNLWSGPIELQGVTETRIEPNRGITLGGYVSGAGGFTGGKGGWLQLACPTNTFQGGVTAISPANLAGPTGGVAVVVNGAVPADGGPVVIGNSSLYLAADNRFDLPALEVRGAGRVDGEVFNSKIIDAGTADGRRPMTNNAVVASLKKTDAGTLDLVGAITVTGTTEIAGGTLRLASRVPEGEPGLDVWHARNYSGSAWQEDVPTSVTNLEYWGVSPEGVAAAYHKWAWSAVGSYYYKGYVWIPGNVGEKKRCNFISAMARNARVVIAGETVVFATDNENQLTGITTGSGGERLHMNPPVELDSGWQPIYVYCGNNWGNDGGPWNETARGWTKDFGIGVDWDANCVTNVANYDKLVDPGDGSFLRRSLTAKDAIDPTPYRATFDGPMAFGAGTTLDLNDVEPYTPLVVSTLIGTPAVTNGAVTVVGATWTLRAADLLADGCLSIAANARVSFPARVTVDITDVADLRQKELRCKGGTILAAATADGFPADTDFRLSDATKAARWRLERSGNTLNLCDASGLVIVFR